MKNYLLLIGIIFLIVPYVEAFGVSPAIQQIPFTPSEIIQGSFNVYHDGTTPLIVSFSPQGTLSGHIVLQSSASLSQGMSTIPYTLTLPVSLPPGDQSVEIFITPETPSSQGQTEVGAKIILITQLKVSVPYPGKYPVMELAVNEHPTEIDLISNVQNKGTESINEAYVIFRVTDATSVKGTFSTTPAPIQPQERVELKTSSPSFPPGNYHIEATLHYDGKEMKQETDISLSTTKSLVLESINVNDYSANSPVEFSVELKNEGNAEEQATIEIKIMDKEKEIAKIKSEEKLIPPFSTKTIPLYWETTGLAEGTYEGYITLKSKTQQEQKTITLLVSGSDLEVGWSTPPITGEVTAQLTWSPLYTIILAIILGVIIAIGIVVWVIRRNQE